LLRFSRPTAAAVALLKQAAAIFSYSSQQGVML
jgi:hypothetical protein